MYSYTEFDDAFIAERNAQFRAQVERRIDGSLTEDEFKPLRLMNGLYLQLHAYMLRVAIPYGTLSSRQMHKLADIAAKWDKGYGHFTTRQNIQYNWPQLRDVPDMLDALAEVNMHAIQTSGNTIRNVTADHFAGAAADEIADPRPVAELIRQWSTDHPEFQFLPRKFKVAVSGAPHDRAVIKAHDIGLQIVEKDGEIVVHRVADVHDPITVKTLYGWDKVIPTRQLWHHKSCGQCGNIPGYPTSLLWLMNKMDIEYLDETDQTSCTAWNYHGSGIGNLESLAAVFLRNNIRFS